MHTEHHALKGYLYIAGAALFWGASATLGKAVFNGLLAGRSVATPIDALILAQSRTTISFLILVPVVLLWKGRAGLRLERGIVLRCFALGIVGLAGSNFFYYYAIEKTTVAIAITVQYTAPIWVLLYMVIAGRERATAARLLAVLLAFCGIAFVIGMLTFDRNAPFLHPLGVKLSTAGVIASLMAALSFAFYNIYGSNLVTSHDRLKVLVYALLGVALFWMVVNPPWRVIAAHYTGVQWLFLLVFAVLSMLIPFFLYFSGLRHLDPTRAIVTSCLEPVFAIVIAATFVHEKVGWPQVIGIIAVLAATLLVQLPTVARQEVPVGAEV